MTDVVVVVEEETTVDVTVETTTTVVVEVPGPPGPPGTDGFVVIPHGGTVPPTTPAGTIIIEMSA